jgi:purine-binding chemotaxis protein CheW
MTGNGADALYGVFRTGDVRVALPLTELREVIMRPPAFELLPATAEGLLGAVNLRHVVIPVLDLRQLSGHPADGGGQVIVIVARDGRVFGLLADEIEGTCRITSDALLETSVGGDRRALFSHTFERTEDAVIVSLLDAEAISALPGIPVVRDSGLRGADVDLTGTGSDASRRTVMLLRCAGTGLSIDVRHVHSVIPQLVVRPSPMDGDLCRGVVHLQGRAVPAVDPLHLLGLGAVKDDGSLRGLVLAMPRGLVVLTVSDISDITAVPVTDELPLPPFGIPRPELLNGVLCTEARDRHLVLDGAALRADEELDALANLGLPLDPAGRPITDGEAPVASARATRSAADGAVEGPDGRRIVPNVRKYLTYDAGGEVATPLDQVNEILPFPEQPISLDTGGAIIGIFTHRRMSVPLLSLTAVLGRPVALDAATARVLMIDVPGDDLVGFVVPSLHAIEDSVWEESSAGDTAGSPLQASPLVRIGTEEQGRILPSVDLCRLAAAQLVGS